MKKRIGRNFNLAFYSFYGVSALIGTVSLLVTLVVWLSKVFNGSTDFSLTKLVVLLIGTAILGGFAYTVLKVGKESLD